MVCNTSALPCLPLFCPFIASHQLPASTLCHLICQSYHHPYPSHFSRSLSTLARPSPPPPFLFCPQSVQAAMRVREARQEAQDRALAEAFSRNPDAAFWAPKATLPPPPGVLAAQAAWSHGSTGTGMGTSSQGSALTARLTQTAGALATGDPCSSGGPGPAGAVMGELTKGCTAHGAGDAWNKRAATGPGQTCGQRGGGGSSYVGKDLFVLHRHQVAAGASGVLRGATSGDKQRQFVGGAATAATAAGESEPSTTFSVAHCTFEPQWSLNSVQLRV